MGSNVETELPIRYYFSNNLNLKIVETQGNFFGTARTGRFRW